MNTIKTIDYIDNLIKGAESMTNSTEEVTYNSPIPSRDYAFEMIAQQQKAEAERNKPYDLKIPTTPKVQKELGSFNQRDIMFEIEIHEKMGMKVISYKREQRNAAFYYSVMMEK